MTVWGILVAAGSGERLGSAEPKAFVDAGGTALFVHPLRTMLGTSLFDGIVVAVPAGYEERAAFCIFDAGLRGVEITVGGATRQASVGRALERVPAAATIVVVHDAARPLATPAMFESVIDAARTSRAAICAEPLSDTVKEVIGGRIVRTVDRSALWAATTPQAFEASSLRAAHERAESDDFEGTDDSSLVERLGIHVVVVRADERNPKVTTQADLRWLREHLDAASLRGVGVDAHRLAAGRRLLIGGIEIPSARGLDGHSDADVLCHAIADAILGAAHAGDLGTHFPSSDERWRDAPGPELLRQARKLLEEKGYEVAGADATVIAQEPVLSPYRTEMQRAIAAALAIDPSLVNVKFTTTDKLGLIGAGDGIAALAVVDARPLVARRGPGGAG